MKEQTFLEKARERIVENRQKGEIFRIRFRDDPCVYEGIPLEAEELSGDGEECFLFKVLKPASERSTRTIPYRCIENLESLL